MAADERIESSRGTHAIDEVRPGYDEEHARQRPHPALEDHMEYGFASHVLLWLIGAMAAVGLLLTVVGFWSLGRSAYRKD